MTSAVGVTAEILRERCTHIVAGIEGSGTGWMARLLSTHPEIGKPWEGDYPGGCWHMSYPLWPGYFSLREIWPEGNLPLLVMLRDRTCSERSRAARKFDVVHDQRYDRRTGLKELIADIEAWRRSPVFVSYEGLIDLGQPYLDAVLQAVGLSTGLALIARDGNAKYLR